MNNGDAYVGAEDAANVEKTGFFFKFTNVGRIQIGFFSKGQLVKAMEPKDVIEANRLDASLASSYVDTDRKYF
jgi:TRAP-type mannitol/chloroaromatic compound transport system substrate-binding protein